jgi:hypothetical protein
MTNCDGRKKLYTFLIIYAFDLSLLSKSEIQFLQGQKQVSKSYEYKLRSILNKKIVTLLNKELPLLNSLFPHLLDLTKISKNQLIGQKAGHLTKFSKNNSNDTGIDHTKNSKTTNNSNIANLSTIPYNHENSTILNHNKLYNCQQDIHQKKNRRVRSVVRISRRSSEPQVMGSKPTGPV